MIHTRVTIFLLKTNNVVCVLSHLAVSDSLQPHRLYATSLLCQWNSPGKITPPGSSVHGILQARLPRQAPLSMGFPRQECWSGLWGTLPTQGLNPGLLIAADSLLSEPPGGSAAKFSPLFYFHHFRLKLVFDLPPSPES